MIFNYFIILILINEYFILLFTQKLVKTCTRPQYFSFLYYILLLSHKNYFFMKNIFSLFPDKLLCILVIKYEKNIFKLNK